MRGRPDSARIAPHLPRLGGEAAPQNFRALFEEPRVHRPISPSGNVRVGDLMPMVPVNSVVQKISDLEAVPIGPGAQPAVYMRDIGTVEDSSDITTCVKR